MADLFASGAIADLALLLLGLEAAGLIAYRAITGRGPCLSALLGNVGAGACLLLALRSALVQAGWVRVALWLSAALAAHLCDLVQRWKS